MVDLIPSLLIAIRSIRRHLLSGRTISAGLLLYLESHHDELAVRLAERWAAKDNRAPAPRRPFKSYREQALWELIERGHGGEPVLEPLTLLEEDIERAAQFDLDAHVAALPFKALVPLLLFQFPAFVILLVGPLLRELSRHALAAVAVVWVLSSVSARAEALDSAAAGRMMRAKTLHEVERVERELEAIRVARLACRIQLREKSVPAQCYRALQLERAWNLHPSPAELRGLTARLDRRCAESRADAVAATQFLSPSCRRHVLRAQELQSYRSGHPDTWRGN